MRSAFAILVCSLSVSATGCELVATFDPSRLDAARPDVLLRDIAKDTQNMDAADATDAATDAPDRADIAVTDAGLDAASSDAADVGTGLDTSADADR